MQIMSNLRVKQTIYTEEDWIADLIKSAGNDRSVNSVKVSLKTFDIFCKTQGLTRDEMAQEYRELLKPTKDDQGDYVEPDTRTVCLSLNKFVSFMCEDHDEIITSVHPMTNYVRTFKAKAPKTVKQYFGFVKTYLRRCQNVRISLENVRDYIIFPKIRKITRQPILLSQLKEIMTYASPQRRALYYVLVSSGMRLGEGVTLTRKNFHFEENPCRIEIEADNTKTLEDRETYISSEAVEQMKHLLGGVFYHKQDCDCQGCLKEIFAITERQGLNVTYEDQVFGELRKKIGGILGQKKAEGKFTGEGFFKKYKDSVRFVVNIHSMRAYFITKASMKHGETYSHALSGHGAYLKEYNRLTQEEKAKKYLELEPDLFIQSVKTETEKVNIQEVNSLKDSMKELQTEVEKLKKYPQTA